MYSYYFRLKNFDVIFFPIDNPSVFIKKNIILKIGKTTNIISIKSASHLFLISTFLLAHLDNTQNEI